MSENIADLHGRMEMRAIKEAEREALQKEMGQQTQGKAETQKIGEQITKVDRNRRQLHETKEDRKDLAKLQPKLSTSGSSLEQASLGLQSFNGHSGYSFQVDHSRC